MPKSVSLGKGADMPDMSRDPITKEYYRTVNVQSIDPEVYEMAFDYQSTGYQLPLRLHRNSRPINVRVKFDGPPYCREALVVEAETPAQIGNIPQALERYLLAVHLSELRGVGECRDSQPARLRKARIDRGIQLATFRGSPFLPPENDPSEWDRILGQSQARDYSTQIERAAAITLHEDRQAAIQAGDFASAAEVNSLLVRRGESSDQEQAVLNDVGLTRARLKADQDFLDARAMAREQEVEVDTTMDAVEGVD